MPSLQLTKGLSRSADANVNALKGACSTVRAVRGENRQAELLDAFGACHIDVIHQLELCAADACHKESADTRGRGYCAIWVRGHLI